MRLRNAILPLLFVPLYACQPEAPAPKVTAPAAMEPAAPPPAQVMQQAAPVPGQRSEAAPAGKPGQSMASGKTKAAAKEAAPPVAAEGAMQPAPAQVPATPAIKDEPAQAAAGEGAKAAAPEADAVQLLRKNNCLACHAADKKLVGPSFRDVAAKYRGDAGAEARLTDKIARGGSGAWGAMAMPANPKIGEADRRLLARYVLSLK